MDTMLTNLGDSTENSPDMTIIEGLRSNFIKRCNLEGKDLERLIDTYEPVTQSQKLAKEAVIEAIRVWPEPKTSFYFWGCEDRERRGNPNTNSYGAGKSHLAKAYLLGVMLTAAKPVKGKYYRIMDFLDQVKRYNATRPDASSPVVVASQCSLLVLDDVDKGDLDRDRDREQYSAFWRVIDYRCDQMKPTVITSNYSLSELEDWLGRSIGSRLGLCKQIEVLGPDGRAVK